ncbi:MAG: hypothetical protein ACTHXB_07635 [Luteimonas sp.]
MPLRSVLFTAFIALALTGCEPAPTPDTDPHLQPVPPVATGDNAFQVRVTLSEAAAGALDANDESIVVAADYFGYPSVSAQQRQLPGAEEPWLLLARHQVALDAAGAARFPEITLDPERLQMVEQGRPHVRVDVYSAAAGGTDPAAAGAGDEAAEDNLLDCGTFQGELAAAVRSGVDIDCKLIAE